MSGRANVKVESGKTCWVEGCEGVPVAHGTCHACYQWYVHKAMMLPGELIAYSKRMDRIEKRRKLSAGNPVRVFGQPGRKMRMVKGGR